MYNFPRHSHSHLDKQPVKTRRIQLIDPVKANIDIIITTVTFTTLSILLLPHKSQNPSSIANINTSQSFIKRTQFLKNKSPLRRATFSAGNESRPDEAFKVRIRRRD